LEEYSDTACLPCPHEKLLRDDGLFSGNTIWLPMTPKMSDGWISTCVVFPGTTSRGNMAMNAPSVSFVSRYSITAWLPSSAEKSAAPAYNSPSP
jgi:hypothetical protein